MTTHRSSPSERFALTTNPELNNCQFFNFEHTIIGTLISKTRFETWHLSEKLDKFLHEELKIVGCKIKRYFKMCLPVFIGSIKASFGSAF